MPRIAFYSHDTYGLGHFRRCLKLASWLVERFGRVEGLFLTGCPWPDLFLLPKGFSVVDLPPVVKVGPRQYGCRSVHEDLETSLAERRRRIDEAVRGFRPDLFLVDNVPCGLGGEVLPALRHVKERLGGMAILVLRDVLDAPAAIRSEWESSGARDALEGLYDEIWVFGDDEDVRAMAGDGLFGPVLPKVIPCGRLAPPAAPSGAAGAPEAAESSDGPRVLVSGGGGRDAVALVGAYMAALAAFRPRVVSDVVLGPDFPEEALARILRSAWRLPRPRLQVYRSVSGLEAMVERSDVVVAMAGYNTVCEILSSGRRAVLVPRTYPRQEQLLRARKWERSGRVRLVLPEELGAEALWRAVEELLELPDFAPERLGGGAVAAERAVRLLERQAGG